MLSQMFQPGSGINTLGGKLSPAIMKRIEWLGDMNDRVTACLAAADFPGLLVLASQYAERGMLQTANRVMRLAEKGE